MNRYKVRYISGPQGRLTACGDQIVEAETPMEALALAGKDSWPLEWSMDGSTAWAKKPGNSLYDVDAWEAAPWHGPDSAGS